MIKVLNDNVLVKDIESISVDKIGDIFLPDKDMQYGEHQNASGRRYDPDIGTVEALGATIDPKYGIKVGDRVILAPMKGKEYKQFKIYKLEELFGVIAD